MIKQRNTITVYAGSADNLKPNFTEAAYMLGKTIADQGRCLVFGSGKTGLMGAVARGAMENGGDVIGIINDDLNLPGLVFGDLTRIEKVANIQIRQTRMNELGDAFIALPGGFGTLYETLEALTWAQLSHHSKPIGLLNVEGYYDHMLAMLDHAIDEGFIYPEHRELYMASDSPIELLQALDTYIPPENMNRWLVRE